MRSCTGSSVGHLNANYRTCHASVTVISLRSRPGAASESQIYKLIHSLTMSHKQWRERGVVCKSCGAEVTNEHFRTIDIDRDDVQYTSDDSPRKSEPFLNYSPMHIYDPFFASRLNNWRAIYLHINLMQEPMWGLYLGTRFVCAVDICRTHAALGAERNFLGAEKSVGLYLAGVAFGGPEMYPVGTQFRQLADTMRQSRSG